jgi:hypothetical protein
MGKYGFCWRDVPSACPKAGDQVNLYRELHLENVRTLRLDENGGQRWVLDAKRAQVVLLGLDREVQIEPFAIPASSGPTLVAFWDEEQYGYRVERQLGFAIDPGIGRMGTRIADVAIEWAMPAGLYAQLLSSLADVTPTATSPPPTWTPFPTLAPSPSLRFDHPRGELRWDGPDGRVSSQPEGHCGNYNLTAAYGVPGYIQVGKELGLWLEAAVRLEPAWHATGYHHGEWQIWQGDDPEVLYLRQAGESRIAFLYRSFPCA